MNNLIRILTKHVKFAVSTAPLGESPSEIAEIGKMEIREGLASLRRIGFNRMIVK